MTAYENLLLVVASLLSVWAGLTSSILRARALRRAEKQLLHSIRSEQAELSRLIRQIEAQQHSHEALREAHTVFSHAAAALESPSRFQVERVLNQSSERGKNAYVMKLLESSLRTAPTPR